ncbi:hypothetical protein [Segniliparus rugosus]|uniref:Uncharacterized protein n=1 Tax=Segniliparus rugosus (strain ATCC BAA-974 / DSM 45345 / CCUG 50838 / CIP 108380 / JCM 13579 / CDC 945) TaxID=679197 RepID=E5XKY5_SEGRC|nr:hypothetical protein [Segniliparus rugosus]EFV14967.1 hypothetical protein HMPREF9336_00154 [Segniliparus rugosus ATCC BAA-974]
MSEADDLFDQLARRLRVIGVHFAEAADELVALRKAMLAERAASAPQPQAPQPVQAPPQWQQPGPAQGGYPSAPPQWQQPPQHWAGSQQEPQHWAGPQPPQQPR